MALNEEAIASFLSGELAPEVLAREAEGAIEWLDGIRSNIHVRDMSRHFLVTAEMLVRLCEAALAGQLSPLSLSTVAFAIIASDHFEWEDALVAAVLHDWSSPEINDPLHPDNLERFRAWLMRDEPYPESSDSGTGPGADTILSTTTRISHR